MRTLMVGSLTSLLFALAIGLGWTSITLAAGPDEVEIAPASFAFEDVAAEVVSLEGADTERAGKRRPVRRALLRLRVLRAIHQACPCNGPDGEGWADHAAFVECVSIALDGLENVPDELKAKILERAEQSRIGEPDFECPERPRHPKRERPGKPGTDDPAGIGESAANPG